MVASREKGTGTPVRPLAWSPSPGPRACCGEAEAETGERRGRTETEWNGSRSGRAPAAGWWVGAGIRSEEEEEAVMVVVWVGVCWIGGPSCGGW